MVVVYSGTSDLLSPQAGDDPMFAGFAIQGYETKTGSHAQFLNVQGPQLHRVPPDLTLEQAGSYVLNLGTITRCLFTTLQIVPGKTIFVEGSATGTASIGASAASAGISTVSALASVEASSALPQAESIRAAAARAVKGAALRIGYFLSSVTLWRGFSQALGDTPSGKWCFNHCRLGCRA